MPLCRVCLLLIACFCGVPFAAQECDELEGDDLTVCLTLMVCMALDEDKARNQCLEVARQVLDQHEAQRESSGQDASDATDGTVPSTEQAIVEDVPDVVEEADSEPSSVKQEPSTADASTQEILPEESQRTQGSRTSRVGRWFSRLRPGGNRSSSEDEEVDVGVTKDGVPKQFAATVVAVSRAGYNDALVILSNRYVFVVNRARQSRIEPGDVIVARKKEGLSGRLSFLFYGRGASVDAHRVECNHVEPSRQTRRRCEFAARHLGTEAL